MVVRYFLGLPKRFLDQASRWVALVASFLMMLASFLAWYWFDPRAQGLIVQGKATGMQMVSRAVWIRPSTSSGSSRGRALHLHGAPHRIISFVAAIASMPWWQGGGKAIHLAGWRRTTTGTARTSTTQALLGADGARLHDPAAPPHDRHDGDLRRPRHVPLLRLLGGHAPADVLPHRRLGRPATRVRGHQVLPLHAGGLGPHAARHHRRLLPQPACRAGRRTLSAKHTFNLLELGAQAGPASSPPRCHPGIGFTKIIFVAFFIGFAIKIRCSLPHLVAGRARRGATPSRSSWPASSSRWVLRHPALQLPDPPDATEWAANAIAVFGVINIIYAAYVALAQRDIKKMVAYSSVSHMGFTLLGMAAMTPWPSRARCTTCSPTHHQPGTVPHRGRDLRPRHHRDMERFGGLAKELPEYSGLTGWPSSPRWASRPGRLHPEFMVLTGSFPVYLTFTVISATASSSPRPTTCGPCSGLPGQAQHRLRRLPDVNWRERLTLYPLAPS